MNMTETNDSEPAWLTHMVDQRLALIKHSLGSDPEPGVERALIMTPLTEPPDGSTPAEFDRWEFTCDNCGLFCPTSLWTGTVTRELFGKQVIIAFGACTSCAGEPSEGTGAR